MDMGKILIFLSFRADLLVSQLLKKAREKSGTLDLCIIMQVAQEGNWKLLIKL